jgi:hypothetical protein
MAEQDAAREIQPVTMFGGDKGSPQQHKTAKDFTPIAEYTKPDFPAPTPLPTPDNITTDTEQEPEGNGEPPAPESTDGDGGTDEEEQEPTAEEIEDLSWLEDDAPEI